MKRGIFLVVLLVAVAVVRPVEADGITDLIDNAAIEQGASPWLMECLALAESRNDPGATSRTGDAGLFQFHVYRDGSSLMDSTPWAGYSPYNAWASASAASWLVVRGYGSHWATWWGCVS